MSATTTKTQSDNVFEHNGMLWKPKRGCTTTADEFIAAQAVFSEIIHDGRWNPWVRDDRQAEYDHAIEVMDQWRRAEPGHRMLTTRQLEARWAKQDRERDRALAELKKTRESRKTKFNEERATARVALIEQRSRLDYEESVLSGYRDGSRFPGMDSSRRQEKLEELKQFVTLRRSEIERLTPIVGNPETVIDENGWLPHERRGAMFFHYRFDREQKVKRLRTEIPELEAAVDRKDRVKLDMKRRELNELLAVPPLTPDDMCSDCPTPVADHGWTTPPYWGPCPAWPGWRARLQKAWTILEGGTREAEAAEKQPPAPPKPQPLATIPSGLPIAEITARLQDLQTQFPDAEVRRGRANRWELWPREPLD